MKKGKEKLEETKIKGKTEVKVTKKRGRPKKSESEEVEKVEVKVKKKRGRSKKSKSEEVEKVEVKVKKKRGRPKKSKSEEVEKAEVKVKKDKGIILENEVEEILDDNPSLKLGQDEVKRMINSRDIKDEKNKEQQNNARRLTDLSIEELEDVKTKYSKIRKRIFNIVQYERHPKSNELLINEEKIKEALEKFGKCEYAYVLHDKDKNEDGTEKAKHYHIVIKTENTTSIYTVASRFNILPNFIDIPRGTDAFSECVKYLTHEDEKQQKLGKHRYEDEEIKSNFNFRQLIAEYELRKERNEKKAFKNDKTYYFESLRLGYMTLADIEKEDVNFYYANERNLKYFRSLYLTEKSPMPNLRINFYIFGEGGVGKDSMCRALARSLNPGLSDNECFYFVGGNKVAFDSYDGQDVIIWSDFRAKEILESFNDNLGMIYKIFDTHPQKVDLNIKYSKTTLINRYNIINSTQEYTEFLNELSGEVKLGSGLVIQEGEDKKQIYRRFPMMIPIRANDFDILVNQGFLGTGSYFEYNEVKNIVANFGKINKIADKEKRREIEKRVVALPIAKLKEIEESQIGVEFKEEEFANYGKTLKDIKYENEEIEYKLDEDEVKEIFETSVERIKEIWDLEDSIIKTEVRDWITGQEEEVAKAMSDLFEKTNEMFEEFKKDLIFLVSRMMSKKIEKEKLKGKKLEDSEIFEIFDVFIVNFLNLYLEEKGIFVNPF